MNLIRFLLKLLIILICLIIIGLGVVSLLKLFLWIKFLAFEIVFMLDDLWGSVIEEIVITCMMDGLWRGLIEQLVWYLITTVIVFFFIYLYEGF